MYGNISDMDISVPIVGFIFVCIIFPSIVKSKPQFYMAIAVLLLILVLDVIIAMSTTHFFLILRGVLFIVDFIVLVLSTGGLSLHELGGELKGAYEVMRRGESKKTLIVPLTGEMPRSREDASAERAARAAAVPKKEEGDRTIPFE